MQIRLRTLVIKLSSCIELAGHQYGVIPVYWYIGHYVWPSFLVPSACDCNANLHRSS